MRRLFIWILSLMAPVVLMAATSEYEYVDLGLPSRTKWATCNVGALAPEGYGSYFAWGETSQKSSYTWDNYQYASGSATTCTNIGTNITGSNYDAAFISWGKDWRIPTNSEIEELATKCTFTAATVNGVKGYKVKGPSGKSIFLPFGGSSYDGKNVGIGSNAYYWSSFVSDGATGAKASALFIKSGATSKVTAINRYIGAFIRPVKGKSMPVDPVFPDEPEVTETETFELIDLGLSVKWANQNVLAESPEELGGYYSWGETSVKSTYLWSNYKYADGTAATAKYIGANISGTIYDAAYLQSEDDEICLPTEAQWQELLDKCTLTLSSSKIWDGTRNVSVKGYTVTGPNGNSIFLPLTGYTYNGSNYGLSSYAYYWTSNFDVTNVAKARAAYISSTSLAVTSIQRGNGVAIRPVEKTTSSQSDPVVEEEAFELVDLGLSVKWANQNILAESSKEYGGYYSWGETSVKSTCLWSNYKYANGTAATAQYIGSDISGTNYDAAYLADNEEDICLPTEAQWQELLDKCTFTLTSLQIWDGTQYVAVKGYTVTGPNGNSIFLPLSGYTYNGKYTGLNESAYYWTANYDASYVSKARAVYFNTSSQSVKSIQRANGVAIRPVEKTTSTQPEPVQEDEEFELVDLGLSVKWANQNVLAESSKEFGGYYSWGETSAKYTHLWSNYTHANGSSATAEYIGSNISGTNYDAAYLADYDEEICLPTEAQWQELLDKCTLTLTTSQTWDGTQYVDVTGYTVTGPNGNSIFLPLSGYTYNSNYYGKNSSAYYWTANYDASYVSKARAVYFSTSSQSVKSIQRANGVAIRPVEKTTSAQPEPAQEDEEFELVDLGLSVKWANQNVLAESSKEFGGYYSWGETSAKDTHLWSNYTHADGSSATAEYIGSNISGTNYDAAYLADYDEEICLPTEAQWQELLDKCTLTLTTSQTWDGTQYVEVKGYTVTGPNGNSIFLPLSGYTYNSNYYGKNSYAYYWTANYDASYVSKARAVYFSSSVQKVKSIQRANGVAIRPVQLETGSGSQENLNMVQSGSSLNFETDGINSINSSVKTTDNAVYTLQGVKVDGTLKPGIYIRNGRKFVVK